METIREGHIAELFEGNEGGLVYELTDGSRWRQDDGTKEYVYRERAKARPLTDRGTGLRYLDVEGTSGIFRVVPDTGMERPGWGAF